MKKDIKMIALDLDDTLLNSQKQVTERVKTALHAAMERGVKVVLASGRSLRGILPVAEALEFQGKNGYILSWNGAHVLELNSGNVLFERTLPADVAGEICEFAQSNRMAIITYDPEGVQVSETPDDPWMRGEALANGIPQRKVAHLPSEVTYPMHKMLLSFDPSRLERLEERTKARFAGRYEVFHSSNYYLEVMPLGVTKGSTLACLCEKFGFSTDNLMACGDSGNDLAMIQIAGLGVAMGNADDMVKAAADFVTASCDEDGVAVAVEKFVL